MVLLSSFGWKDRWSGGVTGYGSLALLHGNIYCLVNMSKDGHTS